MVTTSMLPSNRRWVVVELGFWHKFYVCPYYVDDKVMHVSCEGKTFLRFPTMDSCRKYLEKYCAGDWKSCSYAQSMNEFYEGEDNGNNNQGTQRKNK